MAGQDPSPRIYKILVACGTAIATSTHVALKIQELLSERGRTIQTIQCRVQEIPSYIENADAIVATAQVPFEVDIPVFDGIAFLTGIGVEEVIQKIDDALDKS